MFAAPKRLSLVTPGWLSTIAARLPVNRLNNVDLPTLGRPTIATVNINGMRQARRPQLGYTSFR